MEGDNLPDDKSPRGEEGVEDNNFLWRKFKDLSPLPGFLKNFVAVFHDEDILIHRDELLLETEASRRRFFMEKEDVKREEIDFAVEVIRYLLDNGLEDVQLLSNKSTEGKCSVTEFLDDESVEVNKFHDDQVPLLDSVQATVVLLFAADGYFEQEKLLKTVQCAVNASKLGVIIISNVLMNNQQNIRHPGWYQFVEDLKEQELLENKLSIKCSLHHQVIGSITNAFQLKHYAPLGGCNEICGKMSCGHMCPHVCHPVDQAHQTEDYRCCSPCDRKCLLGHPCSKQCWEECCCEVKVNVQLPCHHSPTGVEVSCHKRFEVKCTTTVKKPLECGHYMLLTCSDEEKIFKCTRTVLSQLMCGHAVVFKCNVRPNMEEYNCSVPAQKTFKCGHRIVADCKSVRESENLKCGMRCNKSLECGHICELDCHPEDPDHENILCRNVCKRQCPRGLHLCDRKHPCRLACEPCKEKVDYNLHCGHVVSINCGDRNPEESNYVCTESCMEILDPCRHPCMKQCGEECGPCEMPVAKYLKGCTKHQHVMPCYVKPIAKCELPTPYPTPLKCGHIIRLLCYETNDFSYEEINDRCEIKCDKEMNGSDQCGHTCNGNCKACFQGKFHRRCREKCTKILICGHSCSTPCNKICFPCSSPCLNSCEHHNCKSECGVPCSWLCMEPCSYRCKHSHCTKTCSEVCDKEPCHEPCIKLLPCGHSCVGLCGELCPSDCRICDNDKLLVGLFGLKSEVEDSDRFVCLPDCGHSIEVEAMNTWMNVKSESDEILPKRCPLCRAPISWIRRYSIIMHENRQLINAVRNKLFGDVKEIKKVLWTVWEKINTYFSNAEEQACAIFFEDFAYAILSEIDAKIFQPPNTSGVFRSTSMEKAKFIDWICKQWSDAEDTLKLVSEMLPLPMYDKLSTTWGKLLMWTAKRYWPLHPNETSDFLRERRRIDDMTSLAVILDNRLPISRRTFLSTAKGKSLMEETEKIVWCHGPYSDYHQEKFKKIYTELRHVSNCTLDISEQERDEIVKSFGERSGRWFKCKNGHVYVITECGGATELSKCNECGAVIGGESHLIAESNYLASEMDEATEPLYPTALDRPPLFEF